MRPKVYIDLWDEKLINLIKECWADNPHKRPKADEVERRMRELLKDDCDD